MTTPSPIDYRNFDELIAGLRTAGHDDIAARLEYMMYRVAWTTGSELVGELGAVILAFRQATPNIDANLSTLIDRCMGTVLSVWPHIGEKM